MKSSLVLIALYVYFSVFDTNDAERNMTRLRKISEAIKLPKRPKSTITDKCPYGLDYLDRCGFKYECDANNGTTVARDAKMPCPLSKDPSRKCPLTKLGMVYDQGNYLCYCNKEIENGDTYECYPFFPSLEMIRNLKLKNMVNE